MKVRSASLTAICCLPTTSAWIISNQLTNRRSTRIFHSDSHFLPADVISRTGEPVSGITYSNYDSNPTAASRSSSPDSTQSTTEPFTARGELIDPSASLEREKIISPPVPATPRVVVPASTVTRGHPADEVGVRGWRQTISPPVSYPVDYLPVAAVTPTAKPRELTPEQVAFQQAEMDRWAEAARRVEQKSLERLAEKEAFQKEEMLRWDEAARRDAHRKSKKQSVDTKDTSTKAKSSRRKKSNSSPSRKGRN
ncbi:hypothetical protein FisN_23Lu021 [Fistulifera solaris]|uniref:Uncharacterized protein n=1 Tax=Fistulifera solaris TaxID=1519565 RepID=A0A1Z5KJM6_FISSO|nr:hypothetical protein FisN_23Lu021 [Fistulifera solaris]|eukprot:GAX26493.1 hypothetical protein FisN_23Lu021 [Fistulifera solaris]